MDSPAWPTASPQVRCLVLAIWRRHNGANNGKIPYGRRDAQRDLGCGSTQAVKYLGEAQDRGFIVPTRRGSFDWKTCARSGKATTWRITMEPCNGQAPTNDWSAWVAPDESNRRVSQRDRNGSRSKTTAVERVPERDPLLPVNGSRSETRAEPHGHGHEPVLLGSLRRAVGDEGPAILGKQVRGTAAPAVAPGHSGRSARGSRCSSSTTRDASILPRGGQAAGGDGLCT
jgi:hypothetical protein